MTGSEPFPEYASKQRSKRTWAIRLVAGFVALGAVAYGTLPWWLPTDWLGRRLVNQLSADLKRTVKIERVRVGWVEGVVFEGITIADRPGSVYPTLAKIGQFRCRFQPLTTFVTGQVGEIVVDEPTFNLSVDENGRLNISDLGERQGDGSLPTRNILIRALVCNVHTPQGSEAVRFDRLECSTDPSTGNLRFLGEVRPQRELAVRNATQEKQFRIDAEITVPRLKPSVTLGGTIQVQWAGLALSDLPLKVIPVMPIEQVDGTTTGTLRVETEPDLHMRFALDINLHGVRIRRPDQPQTAQVPDAKVQAEGHWDPNTDVVLLRSFAYETEAVQFSGRGSGDDSPAVRLDLAGSPPMEAHAAGVVKNWKLLRQEWPAFERAAARAGVTLEGEARFKLDAKHEERADHVTISLDAPRTACRIERGGDAWFDAPSGIPKHVEAAVDVTRREGWQIKPDVALTLGGVSLQGRGEVKLPDPTPPELIDRVQAWLETVVPSASGQWTLRCRDLQELHSLWPRLARVELLRGWRGPLDATLACSPTAGANRIRADVKMEASTAIRVGDLFVKEGGLPLAVQVGCDLPPATGSRLSGLILAVSHGPGSLKLDENATIDYRFAFTDGGQGRDILPIAIDASWHLPVRVAGIETLGPIWPGWTRVFTPGGERLLAGGAVVVLDGLVSSRPRDRVIRYAVEINADDLAARWDDLLDKPAGTALSVSADCRREVLDGRGETGWGVAIRRPSGNVAVAFRQSDPVAGSIDMERARIQADVSDVVPWLAIGPQLRRELGGYRPTGGFNVEFDSLSAGGGRAVTLIVDATRVGCEVPLRGVLTKVPGVDAKMTAHLRTVTPAASPGTTIWHLEDGELHLAGLHLSEIGGLVEMAAPASRPAIAAFLRMFRPDPMPSLRAVDVEARGGLVIDGQVTGLHPEIRQWCERYGLAGRAGVFAKVTGGPDQFAVAGHLDADDMQCTLPLGGDVVPKAHKPTGTPGRVAFDIAVLNDPATATRKLRLDELTVDLHGNEVALSGSVVLPRPVTGTIGSGQVDLRVQLQMPDLANLVPLMPASRITRLDGCCDGGFELVGPLRDLSVRDGRLAFGRAGAVIGGDNMGLDGEVRFGNREVSTDQLRWVLGASEGVVNGAVRQAGDSHIGRLGLAIDRLDVPDLTARLSHWSRPETPATTSTASESGRVVRTVIEELLRSEIEIDASADVCRTMLPGKQSMSADAGWARVLIQRGPVTLNFRALVDGGLVTGEVTSHTQVAEPRYHLTYTADSIQPGPLVDGYLRLMFPGMTATGPLTLIDETNQKLLPSLGEPNYEVGEGEMIIHGGSIAGRAAPLWVTRIFPGLNFARFDFSYLHSWFKKMPNGQVHHQMIYQGQYYNVYMIGYSDPTRWFQYEVGVDFLADFDSKYWAETGQGRIPLFIKTGRINDQGKLIEEEVNFVSSERVFRTLFVQNNPVVTAYYAVRQRVQGQK